MPLQVTIGPASPSGVIRVGLLQNDPPNLTRRFIESTTVSWPSRTKQGEWISVSEGAAFEGDSTLEFRLSPRLFARRDLATGVSRKIRHGAWMMRVRGVGAVGGLILSTADAGLPATPPAVSTAGRGASSEAPAFLGGLQCAPSPTWTGSISTMVP